MNRMKINLGSLLLILGSTCMPMAGVAADSDVTKKLNCRKVLAKNVPTYTSMRRSKFFAQAEKFTFYKQVLLALETKFEAKVARAVLLNLVNSDAIILEVDQNNKLLGTPVLFFGKERFKKVEKFAAAIYDYSIAQRIDPTKFVFYQFESSNTFSRRESSFFSLPLFGGRPRIVTLDDYDNMTHAKDHYQGRFGSWPRDED